MSKFNITYWSLGITILESAELAKTLDSDITGDTSKCYQKILIAIIQGKRSDNPYPNSQKMKEIVEKLSKDGKIQEDNIVKLFSSCSYGEICTICRLYEKIYNESILDDIKKTVDGDAYEFFETQAHKSDFAILD